MRWSTTISFALAMGGVLALAALVTHERSRSAAEFYASLEKRYAARSIDRQQMLSELDIAYAQAEREAAHELAGKIQLERGRLLAEVGSYERARADLKEVRDRSGSTREVELLRIDVEKRAGDYRAGLGLTRAWLETHAQDAEVWRLTADLHRLAAERTRRNAEQLGNNELVAESAASARELIAPLSGRPLDDPRRVSLSHDLRGLFGTRSETVAEDVLGLVDLASADGAAAREAYGRSLELETDGAALGHFAQMLAQAGRSEDALDLYTAAWRVPSVREDEEGCAFLLRTLRERQLWRAGNFIAASWIDRHRATSDFLLDACKVAYGSLSNPDRDPMRLYNTSVQLYNFATSDMGLEPKFFLGEAFYHLGGNYLTNARFELGVYAASDSPEPFPFARAQAWRDIAEICRTLGLAQEERTALEGAVELEPRHDGDSWLRLAELQLTSPHGGFRGPDLRWATGMSLMPLRTAELMPRWEEIGNQQLKSIGLDLETVRNELARGNDWPVSTDASPYELYTLARLYLEAKNLYGAEVLIEALLLQVPGFVPALDLRLTLDRMRGRPREIADAFLTRLERTGFDALSRQIVRTLPEGVLQPADERRILRADPEGAGRLAVARSLALRGESTRALHILQQIPASELTEDSRLFAARLELDSGATAAAFERLDGLGPALFTLPAALELYVSAALRAGKADSLRAPIERFLALPHPPRARLLALCDRLLQAGVPELARLVALRLDQAGKEYRGGDVLVRLAAAALPRGETQELDLMLERASAFDTHGDAELIALLALGADASDALVRNAVLALRDTHPPLSPCGEAALLLLADDSSGLRGALHQAREEKGADPLWELFAGWLDGADKASETGRFLDATGKRGLAFLVLALERPHLASIAFGRLNALGESGGTLWPHWFGAQLRLAAGQKEFAEHELRLLLASVPTFAPAWDKLEALHVDATREGASDLELRLERSAALGDASGSQAERDFDRSRKLERDGSMEGALQAARAAVVAEPTSGPYLRHLGHLYAAMDQIGPALAGYRRALPLLPARSGSASTAEYLELCERAHDAEPPVLELEALHDELDRIGRRRPDDPRVLLALARSDIEVSGKQPALGVARAYARLERFQSEHAKVSFERLASGSTQAWTNFLLSLDPARAVAFLEQELQREPGNLDAWTLLARCFADQGLNEDALREIVLVQRLAPGAATLREYVRVRSRSDWTADGIHGVVDRIRKESGAKDSDRSELALESRALLNLGIRAVPRIVELTSNLTIPDLAPLSNEERLELLWARAVALVSQGTVADLPEARARLAELEPLVHSADRKAVLAALRGLAKNAGQGL